MVTLTAYEVERQRRIQENKERMAHLGLSQTINDMRATVVAEKEKVRKQRAARRAATAAPRLDRVKRRSERVQGQPAPIYDERVLLRDDREPSMKREKSDRRLLKENITDEIYTVDHLRALGSCEAEWTLFVDGYDEEGNRVYDKVNGQTCHQCRQKTMGKRTCCSSCESLQGVFCGDCIYMRYGENVDEINNNPDWICPHCRDLCNCSFHRTRRGWAPTGTLYRRAINQGYKSVAHYLVLNNLEHDAKEEALPMMPPDLAAQTKKELKEGPNTANTTANTTEQAAAAGSELLVPSSQEEEVAVQQQSSEDEEGGGTNKATSAKKKKLSRAVKSSPTTASKKKTSPPVAASPAPEKKKKAGTGSKRRQSMLDDLSSPSGALKKRKAAASEDTAVPKKKGLAAAAGKKKSDVVAEPARRGLRTREVV